MTREDTCAHAPPLTGSSSLCPHTSPVLCPPSPTAAASPPAPLSPPVVPPCRRCWGAGGPSTPDSRGLRTSGTIRSIGARPCSSGPAPVCQYPSGQLMAAGGTDTTGLPAPTPPRTDRLNIDRQLPRLSPRREICHPSWPELLPCLKRARRRCFSGHDGFSEAVGGWRAAGVR